MEKDDLQRQYEDASRHLPNGTKAVEIPPTKFNPGDSFVVQGTQFVVLNVLGSMMYLREAKHVSEADRRQIIKRRKKLGL